MMEIVILALVAINIIVLWKVCEKQPFHIHVYIRDKDEDPDPPARLEGDEWKDGPVDEDLE